MNTRQYAGIVLGALALVASLPAGPHRAAAATASHTSYTFTSIADPSDPTFTQLLGINMAGAIAGYYGSGADAMHPNKGFVLSLPSSYTAENYPDSVQTQVIGINNHGDTDGFYIDAHGTTHGFTDIGGTFATVDVPGTTFTQLLSINNSGEEAGYYQFGPSSGPTFVPFVRQADGTFLLLPIANAQATSMNDHGLVGGFYNDTAGNAHGFLWHTGSTKTVDVHGAVATQILGLNNLGEAVGSYTDHKKVTHGFTYDTHTRAVVQVDVPGATSTVINGLNRLGWLVGFYTGANGNTIGFVAKPSGQ